MKLSRTIAYGVHASVQLARETDGVITPSSRLAREGQLPERFLVQILRNLVNNGVLRSTCGVSGGYSLSRPPAQITLRDIVESFDSPLEVHLPDLDGMSQGVRSRVVSTLVDASEAALAKLENLTLADLVRADMEIPKPASSTPPATIGINLSLMDTTNEYDTPAGDSPAIR